MARARVDQRDVIEKGYSTRVDVGWIWLTGRAA